MWDWRAEYIGNHDGDTVTMTLDQGFDGDVKEKQTYRLLGVFAPEMKDPGGPECQAFVADWFRDHIRVGKRWNFVVISARMPIADRAQETLSRYVVTVTSLDGTDNLNLAVMGFIARNGYGGGTGS